MILRPRETRGPATGGVAPAGGGSHDERLGDGLVRRGVDGPHADVTGKGADTGSTPTAATATPAGGGQASCPEEERGQAGQEEGARQEKGGEEAGQEKGSRQEEGGQEAGQEGRQEKGGEAEGGQAARQEGGEEISQEETAGQEEREVTTPSAPVTPGRFSSAAVLAGVALCASLLGACAEQGPPRTALMGATILDGRGGTPIRDGVVLVRGRTIEAIGPRENVLLPRGTTQVDVAGSWIIPGLIDAHAHVERWALQRYIAYGVTTVRDVHNTADSSFAMSEAADLGTGLSPRIYAAGAMIDGVPATYPNATEAADPRSARQAVDRLSVAGAHLIKAYTRITPELMEAITDEAETFRIPVAAHLGLTDALTAAKLGVASIEHLSGVPEAAGRADPLFAAHRNGFFAGWTAFELSWATLDSVTLTRLAGQLAELKVTMVPTLVLHEVFSRLDDSTSGTNPDLLALPQGQLGRWNVSGMVERAGWTAADFETFRRGRPMQDLFVRAFRQAGGRVVTGTDAANQMLVPGASEHTELELLVRAGLTPAEALRAATRDAAALLGADSLGVLTPGKAADLVVLSRDPLADITNTRAITRVMVRGQLVLADSIRNRW